MGCRMTTKPPLLDRDVVAADLEALLKDRLRGPITPEIVLEVDAIARNYFAKFEIPPDLQVGEMMMDWINRRTSIIECYQLLFDTKQHPSQPIYKTYLRSGRGPSKPRRHYWHPETDSLSKALSGSILFQQKTDRPILGFTKRAAIHLFQIGRPYA
jgi:hypothetical protein